MVSVRPYKPIVECTGGPGAPPFNHHGRCQEVLDDIPTSNYRYNYTNNPGMQRRPLNLPPRKVSPGGLRYLERMYSTHQYQRSKAAYTKLPFSHWYMRCNRSTRLGNLGCQSGPRSVAGGCGGTKNGKYRTRSPRPHIVP